mmetsp:Transcript_6825/g.16486  ORF Transcript_6825/g.16486 Transcript_6825/m.16486 type:complete len:211 (+) Transcript_6825:512-1144(+)
MSAGKSSPSKALLSERFSRSFFITCSFACLRNLSSSCRARSRFASLTSRPSNCPSCAAFLMVAARARLASVSRTFAGPLGRVAGVTVGETFLRGERYGQRVSGSSSSSRSMSTMCFFLSSRARTLRAELSFLFPQLKLNSWGTVAPLRTLARVLAASNSNFACSSSKLGVYPYGREGCFALQSCSGLCLSRLALPFLSPTALAISDSAIL